MDHPELYFHPLSGCSRRVLAFAQVHDIYLRYTIVDLRAGEHKQPDYLRLNPTGRVPTLVTADAGAIWESTAILRYLAALHTPAILGDGASQRAHIDQWATWAVAHAAPAWSRLNAETGLKSMRGLTPDPEAVRVATESAREELSILSAALEHTLFVAGDRPTLPDFLLAPSLESCAWLSGLEIDDQTISRWLGRMVALEGWPSDPRREHHG